jgi:hypothetical protein
MHLTLAPHFIAFVPLFLPSSFGCQMMGFITYPQTEKNKIYRILRPPPTPKKKKKKKKRKKEKKRDDTNAFIN